MLAETAAKAKDGVRKGAYVLVDTEGTPDVILMASGSEVQWAVDAAKTLAGEGVKARVVSMPSMEWFEEQDAEYKEAVLPASVKARVSVEAGVAMPWYKYLGSYGKPVSIEQFGLQGDGAQNMIDLGITAEHVSRPPSVHRGSRSRQVIHREPPAEANTRRAAPSRSARPTSPSREGCH